MERIPPVFTGHRTAHVCGGCSRPPGTRTLVSSCRDVGAALRGSVPGKPSMLPLLQDASMRHCKGLGACPIRLDGYQTVSTHTVAPRALWWSFGSTPGLFLSYLLKEDNTGGRRSRTKPNQLYPGTSARLPTPGEFKNEHRWECTTERAPRLPGGLSNPC